MTRILRIINRLNLGGPTLNVAYLTHYLEPEFETLLVAGMIDETEASSAFITQEKGLTPHYIPEMYREINPVKDVIAYKRLKHIIADFKPDIVHTHAAKAGMLGRLAAASLNVPVIVHTFHGHVFHSYFPKWKTDLFIRMERYVAGKSSCIITVSEKLKNEIGNIYRICDPGKIEVIPLGFDLAKFSEQLPDKRKKFRTAYDVAENQAVIVIAGRLVPVKNHALFLQALKIVLEKAGPPIRAFIVGDGEEHSRLENLARSLEIDYVNYNQEKRPAALTFTSWIKEMDEVYAGADIVALTSLNEGTPVTLIEAMAAGKAIIATDVGGVRDIMKDKSFLVASDDVAAFAEKLLQLCNDDNLRNKTAAANSTDVRKEFDYRRLVSDTRQLYLKLLNS